MTTTHELTNQTTKASGGANDPAFSWRTAARSLTGRAGGSAGIGHHRSLLGLLGSAGAVGSVGVAAVGRLVRWSASRWLRSARRMIAQARVVGWRAWLSLYSSTTTLAPSVAYCSSRRTHWYSSAADRSRAGRAPGLRATNTGSKVGMAGWPLRWRAAALARWRIASGLRAGMPRPWRVNALRSEGQVVPSSWAAALMLPSCSASWKARSASARSARKRLGCQPSGWRSCPRPYSAPHSAMSGCCRRPTSSSPPAVRGCGCGRQPARGRHSQHGAWAG